MPSQNMAGNQERDLLEGNSWGSSRGNSGRGFDTCAKPRVASVDHGARYSGK